MPNGQVATQYCDLNGNVSMDEEWNVNGSYAAIEGIQAGMVVYLERWLTANAGGDACSHEHSTENRISRSSNPVLLILNKKKVITNIFRRVNKSRKTAPKRAVFLCPVFDEK